MAITNAIRSDEHTDNMRDMFIPFFVVKFDFFFDWLNYSYDYRFVKLSDHIIHHICINRQKKLLTTHHDNTVDAPYFDDSSCIDMAFMA